MVLPAAIIIILVYLTFRRVPGLETFLSHFATLELEKVTPCTAQGKTLDSRGNTCSPSASAIHSLYVRHRIESSIDLLPSDREQRRFGERNVTVRFRFNSFEKRLRLLTDGGRRLIASEDDDDDGRCE